MHTVRDRDKYLDFDGELIAHSSSGERNADRWVEFNLYRTLGREYVISRIGHSRVYHAHQCDLLDDARLPFASPPEGAQPCVTCRPELDLPVRPETARYYARVHRTPEDVVQKLYRTDAKGVQYLTRVARLLIERAALHDQAFAHTLQEQVH